jgi:hydrogenase maturation protease
MNAPILIFGWGNPSRGDDALGPLFVERIEALGLSHVECLTDFQLQVEHALDLEGRELILFVDASVDCVAPYAINRIEPARDASFSTHAISPAAVMQVFVDLHDDPPPPCYQLAIRGESFELGEELSSAAQLHLETALRRVEKLLSAARTKVNFNPAAELI